MYGQQTTKLKEADLKAIGGLGELDQQMPGLGDLVPLAARACERFREALNGKLGRHGVSRWFEAAARACQGLREANSGTALGFLLRKGIQTIANDYYTAADAVWQKYSEVVSSDGWAEWYAPLFPTTIAGPVDRGGRFPEARVSGEDLYLVNQKFGRIVAFDRELFDDDKTGQIKSYSRHLAESMSVLESVYAAFRFLGSARSYANITVPASNYATTDINGTAISTPFSTTMYGASLGNRAQTFTALNMGRMKNAFTTLMNAVDPSQNKIIVNPNRLLVSSQDVINGKLLLAPGLYPAVVGQSNTSAAANPTLGAVTSAAGADQGVLAGTPGGWGSDNPYAGMGIELVVERYLPDWAWALGQNRGFVKQERDPFEVQQEGPNTGVSFDFDVIRFRSRKRFEQDWLAPRMWYLGNDGTATGQL